MKRRMIFVFLLMMVILVCACTLRHDPATNAREVEIAVSCEVNSGGSGGKSLISDGEVQSVTVTAEDSSGIVVGTATLTQGTMSWTGSMSVTVSGSETITFRARGWSAAGGTGSMLYYGKSCVSVSESDTSMSISIGTLLQTITAQWAKSVFTTQPNTSYFNGIAVGDSGNSIFAAGIQTGTGEYRYGGYANATGRYSGNNVVLVKYNSLGTAQWARTVISSAVSSSFTDVAADNLGNIWAVGSQGSGFINYGGPGVNGSYNGTNCVIVKYNSSGVPQWGKSATSAPYHSFFNGVALDSSGNSYAVGIQRGQGAFTYGEGITVTGAYSGDNAVIVKYDVSGNCQWAKTVIGGTSHSSFNNVTVDASGNIYAAGYQYHREAFTYDTGVSATGTCFNNNVLLVKYDASGSALWAKTVSAGTGPCSFDGVTVDASGNVYAAGYQNGTGIYSYGADVSATGTAGRNIVLVKYNSSGAAQWARTVSTGPSESWFRGVSVDSVGNVYVVGGQKGTESFTYGPGVSATGINSNNNILLVKYDTDGTALGARTVKGGTNSSGFYGIVVDATGNIYSAGYQNGSEAFTYDMDVSAKGFYTYNNAMLVKYAQ